jgi:hypothetical protein
MQDWLSKYLPRFENEGASGALVADPVADASDPAAAPVVPEPVDPAPEPATAPGKSPWYLSRIAEEAAARRQADERAAASERRASEAEALAQRLSKGVTDPVPAREATPTDNRQAEIRAEAERQRFYEDTVEVRNRGIAQYGASFGETLNILGAVGATNDDFIKDVFAVDKADAHGLLKRIAADPEKAASLAQLNSRQRIAELTRMSLTDAPKSDPAPAATPAPATRGVSKAPAPAPRIEPTATKSADWWNDETSDADFSKGFDANLKARMARR